MSVRRFFNITKYLMVTMHVLFIQFHLCTSRKSDRHMFGYKIIFFGSILFPRKICRVCINTHIKEAKIHIDTLSSFKGFGGGTYKMTMVKKMTATEDFLKMPPEDRKCEVERYEECRARKIIEKCNCDSSAIFGAQVCKNLINRPDVSTISILPLGPTLSELYPKAKMLISVCWKCFF